MFANFTVETCTGTGDTLALAGAVAGRIPFSASFADGDLVAYVVEDSGGTIKVAGVGTYVSATDDITRNDTWNWNGTAPDDNPSTNITLSGGTHTVRCDVFNTVVAPPSQRYDFLEVSSQWLKSPAYNGEEGNGTLTLSSAYAYKVPFYLPAGSDASAIRFEVTTAQASSLTRVGLTTVEPDGEVGKLIAESSSIDTATTGVKEGTFTAVHFPVATIVYAWIISDSAIAIQARPRWGIKPSTIYALANQGDFRSYMGLNMDVASGAPVYPTPVAMNDSSVGNTPDLLIGVNQ